MTLYEWKDPQTGDTELADSADIPPREGWIRVWSFGVGAVTGAGSSPSRSSVSKKGA